MDDGHIMLDGEDKLNMNTGYFTRETFNLTGQGWKKFEETTTQLIKDSKQLIDGRYWYLTTIILPGGTLFPDGKPDAFKWIVAPIVTIDKEDQMKVPGKENHFFTTRVAVEDAKKFNNFLEGMTYLGML